MFVRFSAALVVTCAAIVGSLAAADDLKPTVKPAGPFDVTAFSGDKKGKTLCYYCKFNGDGNPGVVMIFTSKADEDLAKLVKAIDEVQKNNKDLGTCVVGVSGVKGADLEKLQETHKLTTPLTVAEDKDGPGKWALNKDAAVNVVVYKKGGKVEKTFAFKSTADAAKAAADVATAAQGAVK